MAYTRIIHSEIIKDVIPPVSCFEVTGEESEFMFGSSSNINLEENVKKVETIEPSLVIKKENSGNRSERALMYAEKRNLRNMSRNSSKLEINHTAPVKPKEKNKFLKKLINKVTSTDKKSDFKEPAGYATESSTSAARKTTCVSGVRPIPGSRNESNR